MEAAILGLDRENGKYNGNYDHCRLWSIACFWIMAGGLGHGIQA